MVLPCRALAASTTRPSVSCSKWLSCPGGTLEQRPEGQARVFSGLVDTGADVTCISDKVSTVLDLQPTGKVQMVGATDARCRCR